MTTITLGVQMALEDGSGVWLFDDGSIILWDSVFEISQRAYDQVGDEPAYWTDQDLTQDYSEPGYSP